MCTHTYKHIHTHIHTYTHPHTYTREILTYLCATIALYDMSRETDVSVTLYSRKVMILAKANHVLPKWLRFVKGYPLTIYYYS